MDTVKSTVGLAGESVKHKKEELTEDARHAAAVAAEEARHAARDAQFSDPAHTVKEKLHDAKRDLKQKAAKFVDDHL